MRRPASAWPLIVAANRDELRLRPWRAPARHWPDRADVVAGLDVLAGGSWLGINDEGVVAAVLNRVGTLGPATGKRSRGELVLDALDHANADDAAAALTDLDPAAFRPFNLIVADRDAAYWLRHDGDREVERHRIPTGLSMVTAHDLNDRRSPRVRHYLPQFQAAPPPDPATDDWQSWTTLLADRTPVDGDPRNAMTIVTDGDYGTVSSTLLALPADGSPILKFAAGRPDEVGFETVDC